MSNAGSKLSGVPCLPVGCCETVACGALDRVHITRTPMKWSRLGILAAGVLAASGTSAQEERIVAGIAVPPEILDPPWLEARQQAQIAAASEFGAFIGFRFTDRLLESGISFRNRVVEDAAKTYKPVHYDHGNGVSVADVDLDGLYDVYFVNQVGANELWRNLGDGRFENITDRAGVGAADRIGVTASFADIDNDGDADLYVTSVRTGNLLFENDGDGNFRDISASSGIGYQGHSSGAVFFDYDRDGLLDLFLTNVGQYTSEELRTSQHGNVSYVFYDGFDDAFQGHLYPDRYETSLLFRNTGNNRFTNVTDIMSPVDTSFSGDAAAVDVNGDGWPDLYLLNMQGHDHYYENQEGNGFVRKSREVFPRSSWGAMGIKAFDWNNDGRMDIYITDMHSDMSALVTPEDELVKSDMQWPDWLLRDDGNSIFGNSFFEQQQDGSFLEISDRIGVENYWPWGHSVGDLNADGYQDIFVTLSMNYPFRYQTNTVLINDLGVRFRAAEFILGVEPRRERRTAQAWYNLNCDGQDRDHDNCTQTDGRSAQVWGALGSRSSAIFDLDNDGDLDIVTNEFNGEPMVLVSSLDESREQSNYLKVVLVGTDSNASGLGARVVVEAGDDTYTQVLDGKSGYLSQSLMPLYFGLGSNDEVHEVRVEWPSGKTQSLTNSDTNTLLVINEPE